MRSPTIIGIARPWDKTNPKYARIIYAKNCRFSFCINYPSILGIRLILRPRYPNYSRAPHNEGLGRVNKSPIFLKSFVFTLPQPSPFQYGLICLIWFNRTGIMAIFRSAFELQIFSCKNDPSRLFP